MNSIPNEAIWICPVTELRSPWNMVNSYPYLSPPNSTNVVLTGHWQPSLVDPYPEVYEAPQMFGWMCSGRLKIFHTSFTKLSEKAPTAYYGWGFSCYSLASRQFLLPFNGGQIY